MGLFDTPYNIMPVSPVQVQGDSIGLDFGSSNWLWTGEVTFTGGVHILHTATNTDQHALEIECDAAGFGDVKALDIAYVTGALGGGEDEEAILINIDESAAAGGTMVGLEILTTEGSATVYGMQCGALIHPILQESGTFANVNYAKYTTNGGGEVDCKAAFNSSGTDVTLFTADDDYIIFGASSVFSEVEFLLDTVASGAGIRPTFQFSTGGSGFTTFTPADGTNGLRNTGVVAWLLSDISGTWATNTSGNFEIKVIRTRNALTTPPVEDKVQIAATVEYKWDKDGNATLASVILGLAGDPSSAVGSVWYNRTTNTHRLQADDGIHNIVGAEALTTANRAVSNTTTETVFNDTKDIAADTLVIGACYEWAAWGKLATSGTVDFTFRLKLDAVEVLTSGTLSQSGSGGWFLNGHFTVRSIGSTGTVQGNAEVGWPDGGSVPVSTSATATVDTTQILTVGISVEMGTASGFNNAVLQQFIIKKVS